MPSLDEDVPADFPQEFLGAVTGAQPKVLVERTSDGRYVDSASVQRRDRWLICADLREQLIDYVRKNMPPNTSAALYAVKVAVAMERKRAGWGLSLAEAAWVTNQLREHFRTNER
jgi:hypothetical protein